MYQCNNNYVYCTISSLVIIAVRNYAYLYVQSRIVTGYTNTNVNVTELISWGKTLHEKTTVRLNCKRIFQL
jgi:hypothetical protein